MVGTLVLNRPLTYREAHTLIGSCVIPIVGGWLVDQAYRNHVCGRRMKQWTERRHHRRHHRKM